MREINFHKYSLVSQSGKKADKPVFYEQKTVIVSEPIKIKLFYKFYSGDPARRLKNAEITGIITKNGKVCFKIKDTYDENGNIKFKQIEFSPFLPDKNTESHIIYKCAAGQNNVLYLYEVNFKDTGNKIWIESFDPGAAPPNPREYAEIPQLKSDDTKLYAPYPQENNLSFEKYFNCGKAELTRWLFDNFTTAQNRAYFDMSPENIQNLTEEDIENLFLK